MIIQALILSLQITAIHICFSEGNIFSFIRVWFANRLDNALGKKRSKYVQQPLWGCPVCMASFWTIALTMNFNLWLILCVCGFNVIISRLKEDEGPTNK